MPAPRPPHCSTMRARSPKSPMPQLSSRAHAVELQRRPPQAAAVLQQRRSPAARRRADEQRLAFQVRHAQPVIPRRQRERQERSAHQLPSPSPAARERAGVRAQPPACRCPSSVSTTHSHPRPAPRHAQLDRPRRRLRLDAAAGGIAHPRLGRVRRSLRRRDRLVAGRIHAESAEQGHQALVRCRVLRAPDVVISRRHAEPRTQALERSAPVRHPASPRPRRARAVAPSKPQAMDRLPGRRRRQRRRLVAEVRQQVPARAVGQRPFDAQHRPRRIEPTALHRAVQPWHEVLVPQREQLAHQRAPLRVPACARLRPTAASRPRTSPRRSDRECARGPPGRRTRRSARIPRAAPVSRRRPARLRSRRSRGTAWRRRTPRP